MKWFAIVACCVLSILAPLTWYLSTPQPRRSRQPRARPERVVLPLHRPEQADRDALPDLVRANNAFALDLYRAMHSTPGNLVVSPGMLDGGTCPACAARAVKPPRRLIACFTCPAHSRTAPWPLIQDLNAEGEQGVFQIRMADAVWVQQGSPRRRSDARDIPRRQRGRDRGRISRAVRHPRVGRRGSAACRCRRSPVSVHAPRHPIGLHRLPGPSRRSIK